MNAIDFFCGGGGMTKGLIDAGIDVIFGLDSNPNCRETYENNNNIPYLNRNILNVTAEGLLEEFEELNDVDELLMVGCAPCQPFSILNPKNPNEHISVNLLNEFGRLVEGIHPAHVLIENVPGIKGKGHHPSYRHELPQPQSCHQGGPVRVCGNDPVQHQPGLRHAAGQ